MTIRLCALLGTSTALLMAGNAGAQQAGDRPLPYDYAYASLAVSELDSGGLEGGGSFTVAPNLHVFAAYQDWELDDNVDRSILQIGAGYHWDVADNLDLVVGLAFADSELDRPARRDFDDSGPILSAGVRGWASSTVELSGHILLDDSLGSDVDSVLEVGGQYHLDNRFSLGGRVRVDEDDTTLFLGGRYYFRAGNRQP